ncbi:hypothetical protein KZZ52_38600 [Dactylosporangium sp. AC04546]|uniref:hypothetical protein n=1 Tax=Dactylosporangium sp. AC04546 TaxID=2862460 RepID=UPI001EDF0CAB|nr:hypothetical protein [Dactylosporangium sp. AC04546]WVK79867.1 hypothetical protein KZZ52_38600 [Dactylosporangium sp. AC04546]
MDVRGQVRLVYATIGASALLLAVDVALSAAALINLSRLDLRMVSEQQLHQVRIDMANNLVVTAVGAVIVGVLVLVVRTPSNKVRVALWTLGPLIALALLCGLVGGPEWAVAPTGEEPQQMRDEYAQAVPGWYVTFHGIAGLLAAALLIFAAVFVTRADMREYYLDNVDGTRYRSWVDRA